MRIITFLFCLLAVPMISFAQTARQISGEDIAGSFYRYQSFPTKVTEARNVDVWLPPDYEKDPKKRYSVLYMHDGQNLFNPKESFGGVDWAIDETMTRLIKEKKIKETIVVGIWNTPRRSLEFMPQKAFDRAATYTKNPNQSPPAAFTDSGSDNYLRFIVQELKPFIDRTYRTNSDRKNTFIMGSSMGALMSLYAVSEFPEIFGGAGCLSTQFPLGRGVMLDYMKKHLPSPKQHKIYFDYGTKTLDKDSEPYQRKADAIMRLKGYKSGKNWITRKFEGEEHSEKSWRKRADIPITYLLGK